MAKKKSPSRKGNKTEAAPAVKPGRAPDPRREAAGGSRIESGRAPGRAGDEDGGGRVLLESVKGDGRRRRAVFGAPAAAEANYAREAEGGGGPPEFDASRAVPAGLLSYGGPLARRLARLERALQPEALFQGDRRQVDPTTQYPYSAICHLRMWFPKPFGGYVFAVGTGWAIGKGTIVTAGHCVYVFHDPDFNLSRVWAEQIEVIPARNGDADAPFGSITVKTDALRTTKGWEEHGQEAADFGAIILDEALDEEVYAFGFGPHTDAQLHGRKATIAGYPGELNEPPLEGTMWEDDDPPLFQPSASQLHYRIDTTPGQSGAPVFYLRPAPHNDAVAVGIHNYGQQGASNSATRITEGVTNLLVKWRDEGGGL